MPSIVGTNGDDTFVLTSPRLDFGTFWGENGVDTLVLPGNSSDYFFHYYQPLHWVQGIIQQPRLQVVIAYAGDLLAVADLRSVEFIQFDDLILDVSTLHFTLTGTNGNDILLALYNGSTLFGGDGNDDLIAYEGNDRLYGGNGDDILTEWPLTPAPQVQVYDHWGNDFFDGGKGIDTLQVYFVFENSPRKFDFLTSGSIVSEFGTITYKNFEQVIVKGALNFSNDLAGGNFADQLTGGNVSDILNGRGGNDVIYGGEGQDTIFGGSGNDEIWGDESDFLTNNNDTIFAGDGDDWVYGAGGNDYIEGGDGNDFLMGALGSNTIHGGPGDDIIYGIFDWPTYGLGLPVDDPADLDGGSGNDYLEGGRGDDQLLGGSGSDTLFGRDGWDALFGGPGADILRGGNGPDELTGGPGADVFAYPELDDLIIFDGIDAIFDFSPREGDKIDFSQLDANPFLDGDQAFTFIGMAPNFTAGVPGELIYSHYLGNTFISGNVTGTQATTFMISLIGIQTVTEDYFLL